MSEARPQNDAREQQVGLHDYAIVVWRHKWLIAGLWFVVVLATLVITIRTPKVYESSVTLLAPKEGMGGGLFGGLVGSGLLPQQPLGLSVSSLTPNRDLLVSVLKSRTVAQAVVERFQLRERYQARYLEDAIKALQSATNILVSREGVISLKVEDIDPQLAAQIANFYVEQLDRLVAQYGIGEAGRQRGFLTEQLARAKADLEGGEETLRRFQERNRAIVLHEQTRVAIEGAARLKGEIMAMEVQLQVMRDFATEANPEMLALRRRIDEMKRQLGQIQYGDRGLSPMPSRDARDFTVPFPRVPEVGLELARLTRDVKVQETLMTLLAQQLEQAKIAEARDIPVVQVLDRAVPSERHSKPRLRVNLMIGGTSGLVLAIFVAFVLDYLRDSRGRVSVTRETP